MDDDLSKALAAFQLPDGPNLEVSPESITVRIKAKTIRVFDRQAYNALSEADKAVDCRNANAVMVTVLPNGTSPSATISVEGSDEQGGQYVALPTSLGNSQSAVTSDTSFICLVPNAWVRIRIASISGTFLTGQGFTILVTPFVAAGPTLVGLLAGTNNIGDVDEAPVACAAADVHAPAVNTAAIVTYAAVAAVKHVITGIAWSYAGGIPTGGNLKVEDVAGTNVFSMDITDQGAGFILFPKPKKAAAVNTAMIVTLAAGGAGVTGKASVVNHWTEA